MSSSSTPNPAGLPEYGDAVDSYAAQTRTEQSYIERGDTEQAAVAERAPIEDGRVVLGVVAVLVAIVTVTMQFTGVRFGDHMGAVLFGLGALLIVIGALGLVLRSRRRR